jgi:predicted AAA+ superfamily ATPase
MFCDVFGYNVPVNEGQIMRRLTDTNLWWRRSDWERDDRDLRRLAESAFEYSPRPLADLVPGGLYVLRGPRRVGKSVEVKRAISELIHRGVEPRRILHFGCDELTQGDLARLVRAGRDTLTRGLDGPRYWFLDEITSVKGWPAAVKSLRDNTAFAEDCVVLTGSSARDLDVARKELAGRRGPVRDSDRLLLPMSFRAFGDAVGMHDLPALPAVSPARFLDRETDQAIYELTPWLDDLASTWELYLRVGGYPRAVADHLKYGSVQPDFLDALWDVVAGDALRSADMPAVVVHALLVRLTKNLANPLNMSTVRDEIGVQSHETAANRVRALVFNYIVWPCHQRGNHNLPNLDAQSKYYFTDPLFARLANHRLEQSPEPESSRLTEQQLGIALLRQLEREQPGTYADFAGAMYIKTSSKEVDFAGPAIGQLGFEGKYVDGGWRQEARTVRSQFGRGVLATRSVLDLDDDVWAVPAAIVAWLLNDW